MNCITLQCGDRDRTHGKSCTAALPAGKIWFTNRIVRTAYQSVMELHASLVGLCVCVFGMRSLDGIAAAVLFGTLEFDE